MLPSPVELVEGQAQVCSMSRMILVCATAVVAACSAQQPAANYGAIDDQLDTARAEITPPLGGRPTRLISAGYSISQKTRTVP
jgi:hypothetical protein